MAQHASDTMKIAQDYMTRAIKQLHKDHTLRTMHMDTVIADTNGERTVGRINLRKNADQGTLTISTQFDECTLGELLLLAGGALALYEQATTALAEVADDEWGE